MRSSSPKAAAVRSSPRFYELITQPSLNIRGMASSRIGAQASNVPMANHDDNQHTFDENLRLQNLWDGIELMAALITM